MDNLLQADESGRRYRQLKDVEFNDNSPNDISELMNVLPNIDLTDVMEIPKEQINFYILSFFQFRIHLKCNHYFSSPLKNILMFSTLIDIYCSFDKIQRMQIKFYKQEQFHPW